MGLLRAVLIGLNIGWVVSVSPVVVSKVSVSRPLGYKLVENVPGEVKPLRVSLEREPKSRFLVLVWFVLYLLPL